MKVKGLLVMPGQKVQKVRIPSNLKFIRRIVGKNLMRIMLDEDTILLFDKNAKEDDFNRLLGSRIINGTFLIIGIKNKHRVSLKRKKIRKYTNMFKLEKHIKRINQYKEEYLIKKFIGEVMNYETIEQTEQKAA